MSHRMSVQRAMARLSSFLGRAFIWLLLGIVLIAPDAAHAVCTSFNVPDSHTSPSTNPMASGGTITITLGTLCDDYGLNSYPDTKHTTPALHGTVSVDAPAGVITYTNDGNPGESTDTFVVDDASGNPITINVAIGAANNPITISPASLPAPAVGTAYSQTLSATGGTAPYSYAVTGGSLPQGLNLASTGGISGTPSQSGSYSFTVTVTDNASVTSTKSYTLVVPNPSSGIAVANPPNGALGSPYSQQLQASGALAPFTFTLNSGALPTGLTLASDGTISGTPTALGTFNFAVKAQDSSPGPNGPYFKVVSLSMTVANPPPTAGATSATVAFNSNSNTITLNITGAASTSVAVASQASHGTATASGNTMSYTPTPGYAGPDSFTYTATNAAGTSPSPGTVTITVSPPTISYAPTSPAAGRAGVAYSQSVAGASGGQAPYTYSVVGSPGLPAGLILNSDGTITGTPTAVTAGAGVTVQIKATDVGTGSGPFSSAPAPVTIVINAPILSLTPSTLANGTVNTSYSQTFSASGGTPSYTYQLTSGTLPAGMSLSGNVLSGTPTQAGDFPIQITMTDATTGTGSPYHVLANYTLHISGPTIVISPASLPNGTVGTAYSASPVSATGGTAPYTFSITAGALPPGLHLDAAGGWSGTPTTAGDFSFTVTATDAQAFTGSAPYTVHISGVAPQAPTGVTATATSGAAQISFVAPTNTGGLPINGYTVTSSPGGLTGSGPSSPIAVTGLTNGTAYTFTVTANNGAGTSVASAASNSVTPQGTQTITFTNPGSVNFGTTPQLTASSDSGLPVSFSSLTTSVCTVTSGGTLTTVTPGTCTIAANQGGNAAWLPAAQVSQSFTVVVPGGAVSFATPSPLPTATGGAAYSITLNAVGGAAPYTFQLTGGSLPTGLTMSPAGTVSGTPVTAGIFNFSVRVTDAATQTADKNYQLVVNAPAVALTPTTLPQGKVAVAYTSTTLSASGGSAPYTYSVTSGTLPTGLVLSPAGVISGSPTAAGSFNFTITATDHLGFQGSQAYTVTVDQAAPIVVNSTASTPSNTAASLSIASEGGPVTSITVTQSPTHGTATVNGLNITYTPAANYWGPDTLQYTASGPGGTSTPATINITVVPDAVAFTTPSTLPAATGSAAYSVTFAATGVATPYTFALVSGTLPPGLTLSNGVLSGVPTTAGSYNFTLSVTDAAHQTATRVFVLAVNSPAIAITPTTLPAGKGAVAYTPVTLSTAGGAAPYTYAVTSGALPAGLVLSPAGVLSGTPTAAGSFNATVTSTDHNGFTGTQAYTLTIAQPTPVAVNDTASTNANSAATIAVTTNDSGPITSITVTQAPSHGTASVNGLNVVYTPTTNYYGTDTFNYTATGPGGTSAPATVTITVAPLAVPVAAPQSASVLGGKSITIHAVAGASNGPFVSAAIVTPPTSGTAVVQGTDIVYTAAADASGTFGFDYTVSNPFGASKPAHVTLTVNPVPVAPALTATVIAGKTVQVDLTTTAHGGPFNGAKLVSISPSNAGSATITVSAGGYVLSFTAAPAFGGSAQLSYTLSNAYAESAPGTISVAVTPRSDPSKNAEVLGVLDAQADAARRMATGQISNFQQRLEALHSGTDASGFSNGITMTSASSMRNPQSLSELGQAQGRNRYRVQPDAGDPSQTPPASTLQGGSLPGGLAVWTGGAINFGKMQTGASDNGIDFTTSGVSMGVDKAFSHDFAAGFGVGYGHDSSDVGQNGSRSALDSYNVAFYASYHPASSVYVDGLVGYQWLQFDARRYVTDDGNTVHGSRDGTQTFASVSVGYQHQTDEMMLTPYGRLDVARAHLDGYTEHGDDVYSLAYNGQTVKTSTGTLGLLAQWTFKEDYGVWSPQVRAEFGHDMQGSNLASMHYADLLNGPLYQATLTNQSRNHTMLGVGMALQSMRGWLLRFEYQNYLDNTSSGNQSILLGVEKKFDP